MGQNQEKYPIRTVKEVLKDPDINDGYRIIRMNQLTILDKLVEELVGADGEVMALVKVNDGN